MKIILADTTWTDETLEYYKNKGVKLNILNSYWFLYKNGLKKLETLKKYRKILSNIYIDSGVFSARKKGEIIPVKDLINWYKNHEYLQVMDYVFNMDSGSSDEQLNNCKLMKDNGLPVIGIFHGKFAQQAHSVMDWDYIDRFLEISDYIAIGFHCYEYVDAVFEYIYKRNLWPIKIHLLGAEKFEPLSRYPLYSADSSSFAQNYIFGRVTNFDKKQLFLKNVHAKENISTSLKYNINNINCAGNSGDNRRNRILQNIYPRIEYQKFLTDLWEKKGIKWED